MSFARQAIEAMRGLAQTALPEAVATAARLHLLDAVGVGLAASASPAGKSFGTFARDLPNGTASVFGRAQGASPADAALVNGGLIHSLEFDDTHMASIVHGSAVLAPTALAMAEKCAVSGARLLGAYTRGWEFLVRLGLAAPGGFQARGFQVTSTAGVLAAAAVAAELSALDEDQSVNAVGIALSQASGVFEFLSNGSTVKSLHPGWAAHGGVLAAALGRAGMSGPESSLEGRFGLFASFAADRAAGDHFAASLADLGRVWHLLEAAYKFYPCCHYLHPFIEAAGILADRGITADRIEHLVCRIAPPAALVVCEPWETKQQPATGHAARWSLPIVVAARLVDGRIDMRTFEQPASDAARALAQRTRWEPLGEVHFPERFEAELVCVTSDGATHRVRIDDVYGSANRPAVADDVRAKFRANAALVMTSADAANLESAVDELDRAKDLTELTRALRCAASG
ncbi:MAG: MmgE/PrpD family protein [Pseudolabrys sp.]|jgi:2-methylcitrate dehydratase PrpD